jgi:hypothetical protein
LAIPIPKIQSLKCSKIQNYRVLKKLQTISNFTFFGGGDRVSYAAQAGLELLILLPPLPQCWDDRCTTTPGVSDF